MRNRPIYVVCIQSTMYVYTFTLLCSFTFPFSFSTIIIAFGRPTIPLILYFVIELTEIFQRRLGLSTDEVSLIIVHNSPRYMPLVRFMHRTRLCLNIKSRVTFHSYIVINYT